MSEEFFVVKHPADSGEYCILDHMEGFEDAWEVSRGISQAAHPPAKVTMGLYDNNADRTRLPDLVKNIEGVMVVSPKLKAFLEAQKVTHVEYYPVEIHNNQGQVLSRDYFIAHLIDPVDCIDTQATQCVWSNKGLKTERIMCADSLTILPEKIPQDRRMFRLYQLDEVLVVRKDLADALKQGGFTNLKIAKMPESV